MVLLALLVGAVAGEARMPKVGDYVEIRQTLGVLEESSYGNITAIDYDAGLISMDRYLHCTRFAFSNWSFEFTSAELSIGIPTIVNIRYLNKTT
jgi:hypothetical protein